MVRFFLAPILMTAAFAASVQAQPRGQQREDLLDALSRHISICTEITEDNARLACFDRLQTRIGDVQPTTPSPTPLRTGPAPVPVPVPVPAPGQEPTPLITPGGAPATLGGNPDVQAGPLPAPRDPDRAFDPQSSTYRPPEVMSPKPQPAVRRTGPRSVPPASRPMPLVSLTADNLTYGPTRYWQVSIGITSNTTRVVDTQVQCTFTNGGRPVEDVFFGPIPLQVGEQISTELVGPPTTAYIDSVSCKVLSP
jgi:hypothetical protein